MADDSSGAVLEPRFTLPDLPAEFLHEGLPGGGELDRELLDDAVRTINRVYVQSGLEATRKLGQCVIDLFAGGDLDAFWMEKGRHVTYAALASREDLHVRANDLSRAIQILYQLHTAS